MNILCIVKRVKRRISRMNFTWVLLILLYFIYILLSGVAHKVTKCAIFSAVVRAAAKIRAKFIRNHRKWHHHKPVQTARMWVFFGMFPQVNNVKVQFCCQETTESEIWNERNFFRFSAIYSSAMHACPLLFLSAHRMIFSFIFISISSLSSSSAALRRLDSQQRHRQTVVEAASMCQLKGNALMYFSWYWI